MQQIIKNLRNTLMKNLIEKYFCIIMICNNLFKFITKRIIRLFLKFVNVLLENAYLFFYFFNIFNYFEVFFSKL